MVPLSPPGDAPAIGPGAPSDDAAVAALASRFFAATAASEVAALREGPRASVLVARRGADVVGYAIVQVVVDEAELHQIAVAPDRRRGGVGRALIREVLREAWARGAARVFLEVARDNEPAVALYESEGFVVDGVRPRYYASGADALLMSRPA